MHIGITFNISSPLFFLKHWLLILGLDRIYSINGFTSYWAATYHIGLRCIHKCFCAGHLITGSRCHLNQVGGARDPNDTGPPHAHRDL